jgi:hypothetical protein
LSNAVTTKILGGLSEPTLRRLQELGAETPVPEGRTPKSLRIARIDDPVFQQNAILSLDDIRLPGSLKYGFVEIRDAIVTPLGFLIAGDRLVFNTQILPNGWMRGGLGGSPELIRRIFERNFIHRLDVWQENALLSLPYEMERIEEPAFLFSSRLSWCNFAHLVHDTLIQAPTFRDAAAHVSGELKPILVGPGFHYPAMPDVFARAVGPAAKPPLFTRGRFFRVARLFVPNTHYAPANDAIARGAVARLMGDLGEALSGLRKPARRRLYVSREDSSRDAGREPQFGNAPALERALQRLGFETLVASRLDVPAYLEAFVNSEIIVGLHGAGLLNAVLSASPRVVEITVPGYPDWRSLALFLETGMGVPFRRVTMAPPRDGVAEYDVARIVEACEALLATPCPGVGPPL